jgi:hypothetical protein
MQLEQASQNVFILPGTQFRDWSTHSLSHDLCLESEKHFARLSPLKPSERVYEELESQH